MHTILLNLLCTRVSLKFIDDEVRTTCNVNPEYSHWIQKDKYSFLGFNLRFPTEILSRVHGCTHSHQPWDCVCGYFQKQTLARARQLHVELRALTFDNSSVQEYLLNIHNIVDSLASIGDVIPVSHHIDVVLEGLFA